MDQKEKTVISRRSLLLYGAAGGVAGGLLTGGSVAFTRFFSDSDQQRTRPFKGDAPTGQLWTAWRERGWATPARYTNQMGQNVRCSLCPNHCILAPGDRGRCRVRINFDGKMYSLAYGNACSMQVDPVEKKPLYHFLPGTQTLSMATAGCPLRCLNCQNWQLSQSRPEETKNPFVKTALPDHLPPYPFRVTKNADFAPDTVAELRVKSGCASVSYTYSEPAIWFEYMRDTAEAVQKSGGKNIWVTCGHIEEAPLKDLIPFLDAANLDIKSFSDDIYASLNAGKLAPVLRTAERLFNEGIWLEITNLVVPTYTDDMDAIRKLSAWVAENLSDEVPLHFSRFHPAHRLRHLPPTPAARLIEARKIALEEGVKHAYLGNMPSSFVDQNDSYCPSCGKRVVQRRGYKSNMTDLSPAGVCRYCGYRLKGVWG